MGAPEPPFVFDRKDHFIADIGYAVLHGDDVVFGVCTIVPELCTLGTRQVRTGVLVTLADITAGPMAARTTAPRLSLTADLTYTALGRPPEDRVLAEARVLKAGKTTILTETILFPMAGDVSAPRRNGPAFAMCLGTFVPSVRPQDTLPVDPMDMPQFSGTGQPSLDEPLLEHIGCVTIAPGVLELHRRADILNPAGVLQGGAVSLLADGAAESAATAHTGRPCVVDDLDVRYLAGHRVGPARTSATLMSELADGSTQWRIELRDTGNDNRLGTLAVARCRPV